mmetsp:Transcript_4526/g.9097  ORF Transcript_4526/g.9097 Transcript_4526/m.9097 type:complete len:232 (-) Transcript_4526:648-1343(-)
MESWEGSRCLEFVLSTPRLCDAPEGRTRPVPVPSPDLIPSDDLEPPGRPQRTESEGRKLQSETGQGGTRHPSHSHRKAENDRQTGKETKPSDLLPLALLLPAIASPSSHQSCFASPGGCTEHRLLLLTLPRLLLFFETSTLSSQQNTTAAIAKIPFPLPLHLQRALSNLQPARPPNFQVFQVSTSHPSPKHPIPAFCRTSLLRLVHLVLSDFDGSTRDYAHRVSTKPHSED